MGHSRSRSSQRRYTLITPPVSSANSANLAAVGRRSTNLILLEPGEVGASGVVALSGARAAHLLKVLKVAPGARVRVGVVDGPCGVGTVQSVSDGTVDLRCALELDS